MLRFDNDNIFTGYIKQLLTSFNLPKFKVYTKEQAEYHKQYLKELPARREKIENIKKELKAIKETIEDLTKGESMVAQANATIDAANEAIDEQNLLIEAAVIEMAKYEAEGNQYEYDLALARKTAAELEKTRLNGIIEAAEDLRGEGLVLSEELKDQRDQWLPYLTEQKETLEANLAKELAVTPEKDVLITVYRNDYPDYRKKGDPVSYPTNMRYIPYIKDDKIQIYAPKIVDGVVQYTANDWKDCHFDYGTEHIPLHSHSKYNFLNSIGYKYGLKIKNGTKNLKIQNNYYDSYTHEYLGDYLRFHRDYLGINLMSLYNCFSNRVCPELNVSVKVVPDKTHESNEIDPETGKKKIVIDEVGYAAEFKTKDDNYKIYMVPIKLFQKYTIAMDCDSAIEMCCGLYGKYQYQEFEDEEDYLDIMKNTYACFNDMQFSKPVLFDKTAELDKFLTVANITELAQKEHDLKLFIKVPRNNKSAITILEGDYRNYNCTIRKTINKPAFFELETKRNFYNSSNHKKYLTIGFNIYNKLIKPFVEAAENRKLPANQLEQARAIVDEITTNGPRKGLKYFKSFVETNPEERFVEISTINRLDATTVATLENHLNRLEDRNGIIGWNTELLTALNAIGAKTVRESNHTTINFEHDCEPLLDKLITPLQLLKINNGVSYPFAERLMEYLVGNVVTPQDTLHDNITRAKVIAEKNTDSRIANLEEEGLWDPIMQAIFYTYMSTSQNVSDSNHDIIGFVDKDVEKYYEHVYTEAERRALTTGTKEGQKVDTISSIDIYGGDWEE